MPVKIWANGSISYYTPCQARRKQEDQKKAANTKKTYRLKWKHYRALASAAVRMYETRQNNLTFWTFTFGRNESYPDALKAFSRFLDNFKKTYKCNAYLWTGELQQCGNPHFHLIADIPFSDIRDINAAFCKARGYHSESAVRLPKCKKTGKTDGSVVKSVNSLVKYLCKYMSKTVKSAVDMGARCYAMSKHLANAYQVIDEDYTERDFLQEVELTGYWARYRTDYATLYCPIQPVERISEIVNYIRELLDLELKQPNELFDFV